jgi:hypothetical protein
MVRIRGLEPLRLTALPPQSSVSANSTICALQNPHRQLWRPETRVIFSGSATTVKIFSKHIRRLQKASKRTPVSPAILRISRSMTRWRNARRFPQFSKSHCFASRNDPRLEEICSPPPNPNVYKFCSSNPRRLDNPP